MNTTTNIYTIALFWAGDVGNRAAKLHGDLLREVFPNLSIFFSDHIQGGDQWRDRIRTAIQVTKVALFVVAPDSLESKWMAYEYGYTTASLQTKTVIPVLVSVVPAFFNARLPMFEAIQANLFGTSDAFAALCATCAKHVSDTRSPAQLDAAARSSWRNFESEAAELLRAAQQLVPQQYSDVTPYARLHESRFSMPDVLRRCETELYLVGPNHFYILNLTGEASRFRKLLDWLRSSEMRRARFLLSDMWNDSVFDCYKLFAQGGAELERAALTESWKNTTSSSYVDKVIEEHLGSDMLASLKLTRRLELRVLPTILDNLWFTDPAASHGRCQAGFFNTLSPEQRPFFHAKANSELFTHYFALAEHGFTHARPLWP